MRGRLVLCLLILCLGAVPAVTAATRAHPAGANVTVRPSAGASTTRFTVSFRAPARTGHAGVTQHSYRLIVSGPAGKGCISHLQLSPRAARKNVIVNVKLDPLTRGKPWCAGSFRGGVREISGPWCPPGSHTCPKFATRITTLGKFSFRVSKSAADTTPPAFGGLRSAVSCAGGPRSAATFESFILSWKPATDNSTPRAGIVYEVFAASTSHHQNFAKPRWKSAAGATQFRTPGLPANRAYYFVVRARDLAGNVDRNRVQRLGRVLPCV